MSKSHVRIIRKILKNITGEYRDLEVKYRSGDPELDIYDYIIEEIYLDNAIITEIISASFYSLLMDKLNNSLREERLSNFDFTQKN